MRGQTLISLPLTLQDWHFTSTWAFLETKPGTLGLAWVSRQDWEKRLPALIHLAFVESKTGSVIHRDSYRWTSIAAERLKLWTGFAENNWIMTWEGFPVSQSARSIMFYPFRLDKALSSFTPVKIDEAFDRMSRMGPVIFASANSRDKFITYLKPDIDDVGEAEVCSYRFQQEGIEEPEVEGTALRAVLSTQEQTWQILSFVVDWDTNQDRLIEIPQFGIKNVAKGKPYWSFWVDGGNLPITDPLWRYHLHIRIPAPSDPYVEFWNDVVTGATLISGSRWKLSQQNEQQTIIVAVGLIKKEAIGLPEEQAHPLRGGELVCLSQNGQVIQECKEEIVEQVELCLVGDTVIGVDRIQRRWRLWRWEPLAGKEQFSTIQWLDEEVVHAHVVTNHENSDPQGTQFWLVEERPKGLIVSRREGQTLEETEEPITLTGWSLPYALDRPVGEWDWPIKKGIIGHENALLLIAADEENRMVLYRVEADK
ncbi:MAG TPA: hypothetical protein VNG51_21100 [Ktedonobacteraceae bacterium]|nr:hypothetical protein [Ktedonobacteraceae bacterium]